ncbi:hypothetical protein E4U25_007392 [Claviceps purpurea]|nr:hypothetical protein E4U25_007392 [Claviceps purpurea]
MDGYAPDNTAPLLPRTEKDEEFASINSQLPQPTIPAESLRRPHPQTYLLSAAAEHYVSNMRSDAVMAEQLSFTTTIPDWPKTSQGGCAYAIHMHDTPEAIAERPWEAIQYAVRRVSPPGDSRSDFLGNVPVKMHKFRCSGLKHCEFVDKALLDPASYRDIGDYWEKLQSVPNKKSLGTALQVILHSMNHQKSMAMEDPHQNQATLVCQGHRRHILQDLYLRSVQ